MASKAAVLPADTLKKLPLREQLITEARAHFGLRTEEAIKMNHIIATENKGFLTLKGNWAKGGRPRQIAINNDQQRNVLERIGRFQREHGERSMVPSTQKYESYRRHYDKLRAAAGIPGHGLRHQWAQSRFKAISGLNAPHAGGAKYGTLNKVDQAKWDRAAAVVNRELGHGAGRLDITATYIGQR